MELQTILCLSSIRGNHLLNGISETTGIGWNKNDEEKTMAIRILVNDKSPRGRAAGVTINKKLKRLSFNQAGMEMLKEHYKGEASHAQVLIDDDDHGVFYLRLCDPDAVGSKKLDRPSASTRTLNISLLITELGLNLKETTRFPLTWNDKIGAAQVSLEIEKEGKNDRL
jgi:hypothetical protein